MSLLAALAVVTVAQTTAPSAGFLKAAARDWLLTAVADPVEGCAVRDDEATRFAVRLNRRGQVSLKFTKSPSPAVRACVERIVQPSAKYVEGADLDEIGVTVPQPPPPRGMIVCQVEQRPSKPAGEACASLADCGAGQICERRCVDFQRWLAANPK